MKKFNVMDIEGMEFPAGRRTRVLIGPNGRHEGAHFVQGYVVIYPGGGIPVNSHHEEETYTILSGQGMLQLGDEHTAVQALDVLYIAPDEEHALENTGPENLVVMFVYAPKKVADHWAEELATTAEQV